MADSRRINSNIREEESRLGEEEQPPLSLSAIILSSEFWPPLKEEKLELPPLICQAMEAYTHRYEKLKVEWSHLLLSDGMSLVVLLGGADCTSAAFACFTQLTINHSCDMLFQSISRPFC